MRVRNRFEAWTYVVAAIGVVVLNAIVLVPWWRGRTTTGAPITPTDLIFPVALTLLVVAILLRLASCWVSVTETSVVVRNPLRRHVLPLESVHGFRIQRFRVRQSRLYFCAVERTDATIVRCWGLMDADAEAVARAQLLDDQLERARAAAGLPARPTHDVPVWSGPPRSASGVWLQAGIGSILIVIYAVLAGHALQRRADSTISQPAPTAADRATCAAAAAVDTRYTQWVDQAGTADTGQAFEQLYGQAPPLGPDIARLRAANARTHDPTLRASVTSMVARYAADPTGSSWLDEDHDVLAACVALELSAGPAPPSTPATR